MALPGCNLTTFLALSIVMANLDLISWNRFGRNLRTKPNSLKN
jgi:hypothetical protein